MIIESWDCIKKKTTIEQWTAPYITDKPRLQIHHEQFYHLDFKYIMNNFINQKQ